MNNNSKNDNKLSENTKPKVCFENEIIEDEIKEDKKMDSGENIELKIDESIDDIPYDKKTAISKRGQIGEWPFEVEEHEEDNEKKSDTKNNKENFKEENPNNIQLDDRKVLPHQPSDFHPDGIYEPEQKPPLPLSEKEKNSPHIPASMIFKNNNNPPTYQNEPEPVNIDNNPHGPAAKLSFLSSTSSKRQLEKENKEEKSSSVLKKIMEFAEKNQRITLNDLIKHFNLNYYQADKHLSRLYEKGLIEKFDTDSKNIYYKPIY